MVAAELARASDRLDELTLELASLVRDGADDVRPAVASLEVMSAAGRLAHAATAISSLALVQVEVAGGHLEDAERDASAWAQRHAGHSRAEAATLRRVQRCLTRFPRLADAYLAGELRTSHLVAVDRIIPSRYRNAALRRAVGILRDIECELISVAHDCRTEREFQRFCARVRDRLDPDGPEPIDGSYDSEISLRRLQNGRWTLFGDLTDRDGAVWATLLEERLRRDLLAERHGDSGDRSEADGVPARDEPVVPEDPKTRPARLADAMASLLLDGAASARPGRVGLYLHVELDDLAVRGADVRPMAHTEADHDISVETLWGLLADADVTPVMTETGTPLTFGRTQRLAPDILRRVLAHRDLHCGFPGCGSPPTWNEQHHTHRWEDGGTTDPWVCRGTCRCHHHAHHDRGWGLSPPEDGGPGEYAVTRPDGTPYDPSPRWRRPHRDRDRAVVLQRLEALRAG